MERESVGPAERDCVGEPERLLPEGERVRVSEAVSMRERVAVATPVGVPEAVGVSEGDEVAVEGGVAVSDGVAELRRALTAPRALRDFAVTLVLFATLLLIFLDWYGK